MYKDDSIIMVAKTSNQGACNAVFARPLKSLSNLIKFDAIQNRHIIHPAFYCRTR